MPCEAKADGERLESMRPACYDSLNPVPAMLGLSNLLVGEPQWH